MKIAVSSSSFAAPLHGGPGSQMLTHLEWLEACASRLDVDGIVFAMADFPRTDAEYAAQVKKIATDLGIVPVALEVPGLLDPARPEFDRTAAIELAAALGTGLLRVSSGPPGELPPDTFVRTVAVAKAFTKAAKAVNVTVVIAHRPGALVGDVAAAKHLVRDVDSAWLRYDVPAGDPDRAALGPRDRVLVERIAIGGDVSAVKPARRGWNVIEGDGGSDPFGALGALLRALRTAEAKNHLAAADE